MKPKQNTTNKKTETPVDWVTWRLLPCRVPIAIDRQVIAASNPAIPSRLAISQIKKRREIVDKRATTNNSFRER